jgi:regulatory protein
MPAPSANSPHDAANAASHPDTDPEADWADPAADPEAIAQSIALRKLSTSARSRNELQSALASRRVPSDAADQVLDRLEEVGLIDDRRFARDWVESRQARRHLSRSALRHELQAKGVSREDIDLALEDVGRDEELGAARTLAGKKLGTMADLPREVQQRRIAGALARRGFSSDIVARVLADLIGG